MDELITKVEQWAKDKGLNQADPKAQFLKVAEEFGEIASAMARSNDELFKDSVGDVIVTLIILSMQKGTNIKHTRVFRNGIQRNQRTYREDGRWCVREVD
ncbi:TPA: MazG-like family protein [Enterococcus faecium]